MAKRVLSLVGKGIVWLAALGALIWKPGAASLASYIATTLGAFGHEWQRARRSAGARPSDAALATEFRTALPYVPSIEFLATTYLGGGFRWNSIDPVAEFARRWVDAAHTFMDGELDKARKELLTASHQFIRLVGENTWERNGLLSVVPNVPEPHDEREERAKLLDDAAAKVVTGHQHLVKLAARKAAAPRRAEPVILVLMLVALVTPPAIMWGYADHERSRLASSVDSLKAHEVVLTVALARLRSDSVAADSAGKRRVIRETLAGFVHEADSLGARYEGVGLMPEEVSIAWRERVRRYLLSSGLDKSYEVEFMSAATETEERMSAGPGTEAMRLRKRVLMKFIDELRRSSA